MKKLRKSLEKERKSESEVLSKIKHKTFEEVEGSAHFDWRETPAEIEEEEKLEVVSETYTQFADKLITIDKLATSRYDKLLFKEIMLTTAHDKKTLNLLWEMGNIMLIYASLGEDFKNLALQRRAEFMLMCNLLRSFKDGKIKKYNERDLLAWFPPQQLPMTEELIEEEEEPKRKSRKKEKILPIREIGLPGQAIEL